jgi:hypothetical protein
MQESNIAADINNSFTFFKSVYYINFFQLIVFYRFFTWIALGDVYLRCSLMLVRKAHAVEQETK